MQNLLIGKKNDYKTFALKLFPFPALYLKNYDTFKNAKKYHFQIKNAIIF